MTRPEICHKCGNHLTVSQQEIRRDDTGNRYCDTCWNWKTSHRFVLWRRPPWEDDRHTKHRGDGWGERDHGRGTRHRQERIRRQMILTGAFLAVVTFFGVSFWLDRESDANRPPPSDDDEFTVEDCLDIPYDPDYPDAKDACLDAMAGR